MPGNSTGKLFTVTSFGESHGPAIGAVVDGCPPNLLLSVEDIQPELDRRRPGKSRHTTQRREDDTVRILSGVFAGRTTGTPICLLIENADQRSKDYAKIKDIFRPAHADYTYQQKYGVRDYRGGGASISPRNRGTGSGRGHRQKIPCTALRGEGTWLFGTARSTESKHPRHRGIRLGRGGA